jgi:TOBE domain
LDCGVSGGSLRCGETTLRVAGARDGACVIGVRPESVALGTGPFGAQVHDLEPHGRETIYHLSTSLGVVRALEPGATARFRLGDQIAFGLSQAMLFDAKSTRRIEGATVDLVP